MDAKKNYYEVVDTTEDLVFLKEMADKMTVKEMASKLNVCLSKMYVILKYYNIKSTHKARATIKINSDYALTHTIQDIAKYYEITVAYARKLCKDNNIKFRQKEHDISNWALLENKGRVRSVYYNMLKRCYKETDPAYYRYGKRGIKVCDEWKNDCCNFYKWAKNNGYKAGLQLDRIDNNGNYEPNNCRWVSARENSLNKRNTLYITYKGKRKPLADWAVEKGLNYDTLKDRIYRYGWSIEMALEAPVDKD